MKEEIKEILDFKENADYKKLSVDEIKILEDYITNLQEKCENYRNLKERYQIEKELYKQRNEKAIEYITDYCVLSDEWKDLGFCKFTPTGRIEYKQLSKTKVKYLLNILKGDKDE